MWRGGEGRAGLSPRTRGVCTYNSAGARGTRGARGTEGPLGLGHVTVGAGLNARRMQHCAVLGYHNAPLRTLGTCSIKDAYGKADNLASEV